MEAVSVASLKYVEKQLTLHNVASLDMLPKETRRAIKREARRIAENDVFGVDHKKDKAGNPIEQGIGAKGNMTVQCIEAYIKNQTERSPSGPEPGYEEHLARMRRELAETQARNAAAAERDDEED